MDVTAETAADNVRIAEQRLRALIVREMERQHGERWIEQVSNTVRSKLSAVRENELQARPHAPEEPHLLGYAGYDQIIAIGEHHWDCCLKATGLWKNLEIFRYELRRLHSIRNPAQHGRTLFPHEYVEGQGAAMRVRFMIERYWRGEAMMNDKFWLYIEQAEDSLGNRFSTPQESGDAFVNGRHKPIFVGDSVTLRVTAFDPHGRELQYRLVDYFGTGEKTDWSNSPEFEWMPRVPQRQAEIRVEVRAQGDPHARPRAEADVFASFLYEVRPRQ
jgi:hypothetical protein